MNPYLSVIMPLYNGERYVAETLESVRAQCADGIELVIVDDGSTDSSLEIVRDFAEALPIRLITPGRIGNWVAISNIGLRAASGDWACFLQQDDYWLAGRIARLWREMERAEGALILHNAMFVGPDGQRLGPWTCPLSEGVVQPEQFIGQLLIQNFIAVLSPVFRRKAALEAGGMDEALWVCADWDLWLRLGALGPVRFVEETLGAFRIHPASQAVARKFPANEWKQDLTTVLVRHLNHWCGSGSRRASVERVARASITVNSALLAASQRERVQAFAVLAELLVLGPAGWHRYLRDSRIAQRVGARLRLGRGV
jgi:glycosyltransferase involved in cell wall biosynthesis